LSAIGLSFAIVVIVMIVRAITLESSQLEVQRVAIEVDSKAVAEHLAEAIQIRTVSDDENGSDFDEIERFHRFLAQAYPLTFGQIEKEVVGRGSLLLTWSGRSPELDPVVLMAHFDVVPVVETDEWSHPAFDGVISDGYLWGRGVLDDKGALIAILEGIETLLGEGFVPRRTVLIVLGHDEEIGGARGAAKIAALLGERGMSPQSILDEGGAITEGLIAGVPGPVALVGVAEKGFLTLELSVAMEGGHSAMPPPETSVGILSKAIVRLEGSPFSQRLTPAMREQLRTLAPEMGFGARVLAANLWSLEPLALRVIGSTEVGLAMTRTSIAPTMLEASPKANVLASTAKAIVNLRLLPGDTSESARGRVLAVIGDERVEVTELTASEAPPWSDPSDPAFQVVAKSIREVFGDVIVTPSMLMATTDSRHFAGLTNRIYRFAPLRVRPEDVTRFHGVDERIAIDDLADAVRFYVQYIRNASE